MGLKCLYTSIRRLHAAAPLLKKRDAEQRWVMRQLRDPFVKAAHSQNYRCRSAFKLLELEEKFNILKPGFRVIDCGAAPGAWTQVAVQRVNSTGARPDLPKGFVIGIDLLHIAPLKGAHFLCNWDITNPSTHTQLQNLLPNAHADVILSDMAPNATGLKELDHERLVCMCFSLLELAEKVLRPGGALICKYWDGVLTNKLREGLASVFQNVKTVKPKASRKESAELYFLAKAYRKM